MKPITSIMNRHLFIYFFLQAAYLKFPLDRSTTIICQCYNEFWHEYIDVAKDHEIVPGVKYRVMLQLPKVLYVEDFFISG